MIARSSSTGLKYQSRPNFSSEEENKGAVKRKGRKQTKIEAGVGVYIHKEFSKNVVKIIRKSNRLIIVKLEYGGNIM